MRGLVKSCGHLAAGDRVAVAGKLRSQTGRIRAATNAARSRSRPTTSCSLTSKRSVPMRTSLPEAGARPTMPAASVTPPPTRPRRGRPATDGEVQQVYVLDSARGVRRRSYVPRRADHRRHVRARLARRGRRQRPRLRVLRAQRLARRRRVRLLGRDPGRHGGGAAATTRPARLSGCRDG